MSASYLVIGSMLRQLTYTVSLWSRLKHETATKADQSRNCFKAYWLGLLTTFRGYLSGLLTASKGYLLASLPTSRATQWAYQVLQNVIYWAY